MKKNFIIIFLVLSSFFFFCNQYSLSMPADEELRMYLGTNETLSVSNPTRIAIGNPAIADVAQVSKKNIIIVPKAAGATTLVYWDNFGEQSYVIKVFSEKTEEVKTRIDSALTRLNIKDAYTKADDEEGKVFILGKFNNLGERERAFLAIGPLKEKVVDLTTIQEDETVIEIDVQVLELQKGASKKLGFSWPQSMTITELASAATTGTNWGKLFNLGDVSRGVFNLTLDALVQEGKARILSRPRLSCLSGKEAKLLVGGEVPIISASVTGGGTAGTTATPGNVEYKEYGIKLNIRPVAKENGRIYVNLGVEVSEVGTAVETTFALAYPFTKRSANTELYLDDGQTMAIGGLIKKKSEEDLRKFPFLADVPVLGLFFRSRNTTSGKGSAGKDDSELFITLTPRIVNTPTVNKAKLTIDSKSLPYSDVDEASLDPTVKYARLVQRRVLDNLKYPVTGKDAGFQGTVQLDLKLSYKGELLETKLKQSSGYKVLDDNALRTVAGISSYPPFPPQIEADNLWIEVPISYKLD
jgi:pilus assembly protein CpaC